MEASLWTEMVRTPEQLDYMLFPRLLAVAERSWHEADWQSADTASLMKSRRTHDWEQFANTVGYRELRNLEHLGIKYRLPPPGVRYCLSQLGIRVHRTCDNKCNNEPLVNSLVTGKLL